MDAFNCERNWAKRIPTGIGQSTCFGMDRSMYVPFWCIVALITMAVCGIKSYLAWRRAPPSKQSGKSGDGSMLQKFLSLLWSKSSAKSKFSGANPELESGLLSVGPEEPPCVVPANVMSQVCQDHGVTRGLEAASLAVLLVLQRRRRYGNATCGVLFASKSPGHSAIPHAFDVDFETPNTSFASLVVAVDKVLQEIDPSAATPTADEEKPDVVFAWSEGSKLPADLPGLWSAWSTGKDHIVVSGTSPEEERSFQILFNACAADPEGNVFQLPLLPEGAIERVRSWGAPVKDFAEYRDESTGRYMPITQRISRVSPKAEAVAGDGWKITYEELARRSEIVSKVVEQDANPNAHKAVAIFMGRGEQIAPAFIGVLNAGYQVVPIDAHWPSDRIRQVVEDAKVAIALTEPPCHKKWLDMNLQVVTRVMDDDFYAGDLSSPNPQAHGSRPIPDENDPAILLFTSGSTGRPKGIILSHRYLTVLAAGIAESKRYHANARSLCYHSPTWMPFIDYLFAPLLKGGCCLYFPESETHVVQPAMLKDFAKQHKASHAGFVPAMLDIFLEDGLPPSITDFGAGGAAITSEISHRAVAAMPPNAQHYVGYSGTEQGDVSIITMRSAADVDQASTDKGLIGAGRPHTSQRCSILDEGFQLVGPGAVGEICVTGPGLSSGYLGLPEQTAQAFLKGIPSVGGELMMRTGDLAKWGEDGNLQLVGRLGSMVKVRGARVDLGEVETVVGSHPEVKATVVTVCDDKLVAYVVPAVPGTLRDFCKERMVAYMVPHLFEELEVVPRLPNGKVNKKALPKPKDRTDGAETVMELDSLGQMRKFTRRNASEDRVLDNVRAILIGVIIQSHATPLHPGSATMYDVAGRSLQAHWTPLQLFLLNITRGGGWSSLAFLNGFDDTRSMDPFGFTYREGLFLAFWFISYFEWDMWYLPAFVMMRASFIAAHKIGIGKIHMLVLGQIWLFLPAFVDFYVGWRPTGEGIPTECPTGCFCPWQTWPHAQTIAYYTVGWWVSGVDSVHHSFIGIACIFIPCYWAGFYTGPKIFAWLAKVADEPSRVRRLAMAVAMLAIYTVMYNSSRPITQAFDDRCASFWSPDGFVWAQVLKNMAYYTLNLSTSLTYVVMIAAAVPLHFKYLAKICFFGLLLTSYTPCLCDFAAQVLELRKILPASISPLLETVWVFGIPFLYEFVGGALVVAAMGVIVPLLMRAYSWAGRHILRGAATK